MAFEISTSTIEAMRHQEDTGYIFGDYLHQHQPDSVMTGPLSHNLVDSTCRRKMADWCYQIVDFCKFDSETVEIAMSYLDRFLLAESGAEARRDRRTFQLAAMTALYTAVKIHEPEAMDPILVANLSRGTYTADQVERMELVMLQALKWRVNPPTTLSFLREFLGMLPSNVMDTTAKETVYDVAKLQTQLAVRDYRFIMVKSSAIAFASLMNAVESLCFDHSMYTYIGDLLAMASNIDWRSPEFLEAQRCLYSAVMEQPGFGITSVPSHSDERMSDTKLYGPSSFENSPRSLAES